MKEFDYDIGKYIVYCKKQRDKAKEQEFKGIEIEDIIENVKKAKNLCDNITKNQLSENAKRCIHDIERRVV